MLRLILLLSLMILATASNALAQPPSPSPTATTPAATVTPVPTTRPIPLATATPTVTGTPLTYRMQVGDGRAPDGKRVQVLRLPRPRPMENRPPYQGLCAEGVVRDGFAEITVAFRPDCAPGDLMGIILHFEGQIGITASSEPPLEWREAGPGEATTRTVFVRAVPPNTGGNEDIVP